MTDAADLIDGWRAHFRQLRPSQPPLDVPADRWRNFLLDCSAFILGPEHWAELALLLGWNELALFGANRGKPYARIDQMGLMWILNRHIITDLTEDTCTMVSQSGSSATYRARPLPIDLRTR